MASKKDSDEEIEWLLMTLLEGKKRKGWWKVVEGPFLNPMNPLSSTQLAVVEPADESRGGERLTVKVRKQHKLKKGDLVTVWTSRFGLAARKIQKRTEK